jgi:class 3 adenylate cyclase/tetratricopeptide (TPR) repeat protein
VKCPRCRKDNLPESNFCGQCGKALHSPLDSAKFTSAESYTPAHLAQKILTSRSALEGERKQVTVLFADMKGSLELISGPDPEQARKLFDPVIERMMDAVHRYEGTVNQVMGDGIMAIFGAPVSHEDHAVRACYAALKMQETITQLAAEMRRTLGVTIQIRTGLNSGDVIVRSIGNDLRMDYTAVGQTTHLAGRLEQLATPGSILITSDCLRLAEGYVETKPLGLVALKGLATPIEVHELVAAAPARSRLQAAASRGLTPFVGRRLEMHALHEVLRRATEGGGQVLAVVGHAGVGKSRLLHEFIHSPDTRGWTVLESKSISYGRATPYLPLIDFLKGYFKLVERDDTRTIREKVTGKIVLLDQSLQESIPPVLDLLGALPEDHSFRLLEPVQRQQLTAQAVTQLMLSESRIQPVIMVFEDLHWNDMQTLGLLRAVISRIRESRIVLLVSYRPKERDDLSAEQPDYERWDDQPHYQQIRLEALAQESLAHLLQVLLGVDPQLGPVKEFLVERTGGNPFFVEEIVRTLVETKVLAGTRGQYQLAHAFSSVEVPATISAVLYARIDRLGEEQKRLLQEAAVIGKDVPFALLQALTEMPEQDLRVRLAGLQESEFLYESRLFPDLEYTFKHSLTRDVAYKSLVEKRVKPLHALVANALARLMAGRLDEYAESIAEHAEKGELWEMAVEYLQRSGEKAFALYANTEAAEYFDRALEALAKLPVSRNTLEKAVDLRFELRNALIALCELERIRKCLEAVEPIVAGLGDKARSAHLASFKCNHHFLAAEQRRAIEVGEAGLRLASEIGDRRVEGELLYRVGQSYHLLGDHRKAIALVQRSIAGTAERRERHRFELAVMPAVGSRLWLVSMLAECGDFKAGLRHARRAHEIAAAAKHPLSEVLGWLAVGHLLRRQGELDDAIDALEKGRALSDRYALPMWRLRLVSSLGAAYACSRRLTEALEVTRQTLLDAERMRIMVDQPILHVHLGEALLLAGRPDEAIVHGKRALDIALAHENRRDEPWARFLIARGYSAADSRVIDEPVKQLESALRMAIACEAVPIAAHCQAMLGAIHARQGNKTKAGEFAAAANASYARLDMRPLRLEPAEERSPAT